MKIYSPALITAKEKVLVGHGANLVWCDILSRRSRQKGENIEYFFPSWNHQGKMFDDYNREQFNDKIADLEDRLGTKLRLFGLTDGYRTYRDTDP